MVNIVLYQDLKNTFMETLLVYLRVIHADETSRVSGEDSLLRSDMC